MTPTPDDAREWMLVCLGEVHPPDVRAKSGTGTRDDGICVLGFEQAHMTQRKNGQHSVVTLIGELAVYEAPTLREQLHSLVDRGEGDLILDMSGVQFVDSTTLGVLIGALRRLRDQPGARTLRLVVEEGSSVDRLMRFTGLTKVLCICDNVANALHAATTGSSQPSVCPGGC